MNPEPKLVVFSTLTLGILRKKYLEHVSRDSLSAEHRQFLKQIVEEELLKMQVWISSVFERLPLSQLFKSLPSCTSCAFTGQQQ